MKTSTPVVVLGCRIGGLAVMRSLGDEGVRVSGIDADRWAPGFVSRYCHKWLRLDLAELGEENYLSSLVTFGKEIGKKSVLIPTSDQLTLFVYKHQEALSKYFAFPHNDFTMIRELISKEGLYNLARQYGVPTPMTVFPKSLDDVMAYAGEVKFPVMLKAIYGFKMQRRHGTGMALVQNARELFQMYEALNDPDDPNVMLQEYIPGDDDQVYIFDGYFRSDSSCLAAFTGRKLRQYPVHRGTASLGECTWNQPVSIIMTRFLQALHYCGPVDVGFRLDPRDGQYKVLDINPRIGQALRLFVAQDGRDLSHYMYLDVTGQDVGTVIPREGRRWAIEDKDLISAFKCYLEGRLTWRNWIRSFANVQEFTWLYWKDPLPAVLPLVRLVATGIRRISARLGTTVRALPTWFSSFKPFP